MRKISVLLIASIITMACSNGKHAEYEKNTEIAKSFFKLHETENAEAMFELLHPDMQWHMPVYGTEMGGIEEVKAAILGYQSEFDNMKFTADYWLPGVDVETGIPDGSTRVYGTWTSVHAATKKQTTLTSYHSFEFKDGKIINGGDWFDLGGMMNTLTPQSMSEGNLLGIHALKIRLKRGATIQQFEDYFTNTLIPSYEKEYKGAKLSLVKGLRGQNKGALGMVWVFESESVRNLYFDSKGAPTKLNQEINLKLKSVDEGLSKIGTWTSIYTDWVVR